MKLNFPVSKNEKLYIEMCSKAKQLQDLWKPKIGDFCIDMGDLWYIQDNTKLNYVKGVRKDDTWLPTEEQLQGLVIAPTMERPVDMLFRFAKWSIPFRCHTSKQQKFTIKQLWLSYLMEQIYGMIWGNGEWHKIRVKNLLEA